MQCEKIECDNSSIHKGLIVCQKFFNLLLSEFKTQPVLHSITFLSHENKQRNKQTYLMQTIQNTHL